MTVLKRYGFVPRPWVSHRGGGNNTASREVWPPWCDAVHMGQSTQMLFPAVILQQTYSVERRVVRRGPRPIIQKGNDRPAPIPPRVVNPLQQPFLNAAELKSLPPFGYEVRESAL